ncbi:MULTISPECIES: hypothetical protein [unclassified Streptomyces]|uniref:hypothetical protein n=1 Tax=unclassified Streptomyces TaxID=2593676 RepID=UPI00214D011D|nr:MULTISPECIES: hypothetical protein [unclassified Streptomyces]MCX5606423.1 hypothetical protein [Streptomyces sp. NBC_00047]UUU40667.1 hypothetical protein JIW86_18655 [Streptomyces sp. NBC_00162]
MGSGFRNRAERIALGAMAVAGIAVLLADVLGWLDKMAPGGTLPKITLLILSTVTLFLLMEFDRLKVLDTMNAQISRLDIDGIEGQLRRERYDGVARVHPTFPEAAFLELLKNARREVSILQTWIPNLEQLKSELTRAVAERRTEVRILLLHPSSLVADLRDRALQVGEPGRGVDVRGSLQILKSVYDEVPPQLRHMLQVRVYNSLPSIAVYKADERYLVSSFLHGRLAIQSTQLEIDGCETAMGREVQGELDKLWGIGRDVDLRDWQRSIDTMN